MDNIGIRASEVKGAIVNVNGAEIYYEVRGSGPPVLFIQGATGDGSTFERVASRLADEFTAATYHRRGNSLSPCPVGWTSTSIEEQADDAAALLEALELAPAAVFGTSSGAIIGLDLVIRHPEAVRGAMLHEPPLISVLARPDEVMGPTQQMVEEAWKRGGPRAALEAFVRFAAGEENLENLDPKLRERMLGNGETCFGIEFGTFESYRPTDEALAKVEPPVQVATGTESAPFFGEAARWLADRLGVETLALTGGHAPYLDHPEEMAEKIRLFLRQVSQPEQSAQVQVGRRRR
jgi:pimeloyl-ACP methyl ester carboxylesterase